MFDALCHVKKTKMIPTVVKCVDPLMSVWNHWLITHGHEWIYIIVTLMIIQTLPVLPE